WAKAVASRTGHSAAAARRLIRPAASTPAPSAGNANQPRSPCRPRNTASAGSVPATSAPSTASSPSPAPASACPSASSSSSRARGHRAASAAGSERRCSARSSGASTKAKDMAAIIARRPAPARGLHGEAGAAAAGGLGVRVANGELGAVQALHVVHRRAHQVLQAERIDHHHHPVGVDGQVVLALLLVELEAVLEAGAAAALDVHAQLQRRVALLGDQLL